MGENEDVVAHIDEFFGSCADGGNVIISGGFWRPFVAATGEVWASNGVLLGLGEGVDEGLPA
jgi:hypothetical protein